MSENVKRGYRSRLRAAQAQQTRHAVVRAAADLFVEQGYASTTVEEVADAAGVSRKTVFTAVGGKLELLKTALDWAIAGDDEPVALADRGAMRDLLALDDPEELLTGWAHVLVEINARAGALMRALEVAAGTDAQAQELVGRLQRQRLTGARTIVRRLRALKALNAGFRRDEATDIAWLAADPVLYDRLVRVRGWSARRFERWLARSLCAQLVQT